jgi:hypothetical protein
MADLQPWQQLMMELEVQQQECLRPCPEAELLAFEAESGIILPDSFKGFCQVFGGGSFCEMIDIWCPPDIALSQEFIGYHQQDMRSMREADPKRFNSKLVETFLNTALIFGTSSRQESFVWDLRTYSRDDLSYDIYLLHIGSPDAYFVGREFTEFITEYCLGDKAFRILPEEAQPPPQDIYPVFIAQGC